MRTLPAPFQLTKARATAAGALLALAALCSANSASADESEGFTTLYNGKDLTGWKTSGNWLSEDDGVLSIKPREGETGWQRYDAYLWTEKQYDDFILELEFKIPPKGNSGVFFNVSDTANPVEKGIEVQILDSFGVDKELGHHDNGGIIKTAGPKVNASKPAGEWNQLVITSKGSRLKVELNGQLLHDLDLAESKSKDKPEKGHIGLQDHGLPLSFRNIRIKPLN